MFLFIAFFFTDLNIVISCGPYTTTDNLKFEPLLALLDMVKTERPDLLVMLGPVLHSDHRALDLRGVESTSALMASLHSKIQSDLKGYV